MKKFLLIIFFWLGTANVLAQVGAPTTSVFLYRVNISPFNNSSRVIVTIKVYLNDGTIKTIDRSSVYNTQAEVLEGTEYCSKEVSSATVSIYLETWQTMDPNLYCRRYLLGEWWLNDSFNYRVDHLSLRTTGETQVQECLMYNYPDLDVSLRLLPAILIKNKDRSDPANNVYCDNEPVRLQVDYHGEMGLGLSNPWWQYHTAWQYRVDNGPFHPLVHGGYPQDDWDHEVAGGEIALTLQDMFGADYANYLNKRIEFRAAGANRYMYYENNEDPNVNNPPMDQLDEGSNTLAYIFYPATAQPTSIKAVDPPCVNDKSTALDLTFNRALLAGEELTPITLYKVVNGVDVLHDQYQLPITALGAGNTFSWTGIAAMDAGSYYVNVEGKYNGIVQCNRSRYNFIVTPPQPVAFSITDQKEVSCYGGADGSITITGAGGAGGYFYSKDNGANWQNTTNVFTGLSKGTYTILVKDMNGCTSNAPQTVTISEPAAALSTGISGFTDPLSAATNDGTITITVSGGTAPYTYNWSNGAATQNLTGLGGGTYTVTVTDNRGCTATASVPLLAPDPILVNITETPVSCYGVQDGGLQASVSGGVPPYSYNWSNGVRTASISALRAAIYTLQATDANGIITTQQYELKQPAALGVTATAIATTCNNNADGSISTLVSGGTAPYNYRWSNGVTAPVLDDLAAGNYQVTVTDIRGCAAATTAVVTSPVAIFIDGIITPPSRYGNTDASIVTNVSGGTAPYTYSWNTGSTAKDLSGLAEADYTITVTDANGCVESHTFPVEQPEPLTLGITMQAGVLCHGLSTGALMANVSGGVSPYRYQWSNGSAVAQLSGLPAGTYQLKVTDQNGAEANSTYVITEPPLLQLSLTPSEISCGGDKDGTVHSVTSGGVTPYSYSWNTGAITPDLNGVNGGMYTLHVTDANGCILSGSAEVTAPNALSVSAVVQSPTCNGYSDGAIDLSVSGGRAPFHYQWNTGAATADLSALPAGNYTIRLTDNSGCLISESYTLSEPAALQVDLGGDRTLCAGQSLLLDGSIPGGVMYSWSSPNGFTANTAAVTLSETGMYTVVVADSKGCQATDALLIEKDTREIGANFLVSTQSYTGESVIAVNISQPAAERVQWTLPAAAKVLSESDQLVELVFEQPGHYEMMLTTYRGNCEATVLRDIMVVNGVQLPDVNTPHTSLFKQMKLRPNPNNGQFYVDVIVAEDITVNYRFLDVQRNRIVYERKEQLSKDVLTTATFNIPGLPAGAYVLLIESAKEKKALKVLIL